MFAYARTLCLFASLCAAACGSDSSPKTAPDGGGDAEVDSPRGIDAPLGEPTVIAVTLHNIPTQPSKYGFIAAYQDGTGAWQPAPVPTNDLYQFTVYSPSWGFAWGCATPTSGGPQVNVYGFGVTEKTTLSLTAPSTCTDRGTAPVTLTVNASNLPAAATQYIATFAGTTGTLAAGTASGTGTVALQVTPGKRDLVLVHNANTVTSGAGSTDVIADQAAITRSVNVTGDMTVAVDFSTAAATQTFPVTATGKVTVTATLSTSDGSSVKLVNDTTTPYEANALAASQGATTDLYELQMSSSTTGATAFVQTWSDAMAAQAYTAPTPLGVVAASEVATTPYPILSTTWQAYADALYYKWTANQATLAWSATLSPDYVGAIPTYQMPDLSAIPGWSQDLQLAFGTAVTGKVFALTSSAGATDLPFVGRPLAGTLRTEVTNAFSVTP